MIKFILFVYFTLVLCLVEGEECDYLGNPNGIVHENAPNGTKVLNIRFGDWTVETRLDDNLSKYFLINDSYLVVNSSITRDIKDLMISGNVSCNANNSWSVSQSVEITIIRNNLNPPEVDGAPLIATTVDEWLKVGGTVVEINATDEDGLDVVFSIQDQQPEDYFDILQEQGGTVEVISTNSLMIDSEHKDTFHLLTMVATSNGTNSLGVELLQSTEFFVTVTIVIDHPPEFVFCKLSQECYTNYYMSSVQVGSIQLDEIMPHPIQAQDVDTSVNSAITYILLNGSHSNLEGNFTINKTTGIVYMIEPIWTSSQYFITIQAQEETGKTSTATLSVEVFDTVAVDQFSDKFAIGFLSAFCVLCVILIIIIGIYTYKQTCSTKKDLQRGQVYEVPSNQGHHQQHQERRNRNGQENLAFRNIENVEQSGNYETPISQSDDHIYSNTSQ